jgi:hypothetical protein
MQTPRDVADAIARAFDHEGYHREPLKTGDEAGIRDVNGNTVGRWSVSAELETEELYVRSTEHDDVVIGVYLRTVEDSVEYGAEGVIHTAPADCVRVVEESDLSERERAFWGAG